MLKISELRSGATTTTLRLEGRLMGPWVGELEKSCEAALAGGRSLQLHLADMEYMDAPGVALLTELRSRGVVLLECPPLAAEQLKRPESPPVGRSAEAVRGGLDA